MNRRQILKTISAGAGLAMVPLVMRSAWADASLRLLPVERRPQAPDFELNDIAGRPYQLSKQRGKVVLINFWATWCPPCIGEMPRLQRTWLQLKGEPFSLVAVSVDEEATTVERFVKLHSNLTFKILVDDYMQISKMWPMRGLPTTFIVDKRGYVAYIINGARAWERPDYIRRLRALMNEPDPTAPGPWS